MNVAALGHKPTEFRYENLVPLCPRVSVVKIDKQRRTIRPITN